MVHEQTRRGWLIFVCLAVLPAALNGQEDRARARALGVAPGIFRTGPLNAITDVSGVRSPLGPVREILARYNAGAR